MNIGKKKYDQIPVPDHLERVIWSAVRKQEREMRVRKIRRWALNAAAVFCMLAACAAIDPLYAYAAHIPVVGAIVRVIHAGIGGETTDGTHTSALGQEETVMFQFESDSKELDIAPSYSVTHLLAPNRMALTLQGVRSIDDEAIRQSLLATQAVQDVYRVMIGDDSTCGFVIVLNSGYTYDITEYAWPASLSVRFCRDTEYRPDQTVYYLRTREMPYGENLGLIWEKYYLDGASQLKTQNGGYIVTLGQYDTEEDAAAALKEKYGADPDFFVSKGRADDIPAQ